MLTVKTAATNFALTTLAAVKAELGLTTTSEDTYLNTKILQAQDEILDYLKTTRADNDGSRTIAREDLEETFQADRHGRFRAGLGNVRRVDGGRRELVLARWPVTAITAVTEGLNSLDDSQYEVTASGILSRLTTNGYKIDWSDCVITVDYTAGWVIAADETRTYPYSIEAAVIDYVKELRMTRRRDSRTKSENVVGIVERQFWVGQVGDEGSLPPNVTSRLDRYRRVSFGAA